MKTTLWTVGIILFLLALGAAGANARFQAGVRREARELWAAGPASLLPPLDLSRRDALPPPVRTYLERALGSRRTPVRSVRLRHGGSFRTSLKGAFVPIRGEQYFAADPPGFVWWGRVRLAPGVWVDARDRAFHGVGQMRVRLESLVTLADARGPQLDQGALLRLLAELTWLPTAFLDERYVTWSPIDARSAQATLSLEGRAVSCTFEFGEDGLPAVIRADRYRDLGAGRSVLTPWSGESTDYREVQGLRVPHRQTAFWHVEGERIPYARFQVEDLEYDPVAPY